MLSRGEIGLPQPMHAERGLEIDWRSGTRAATTFTKLPKASAGVNTRAASATFTTKLSAAPAVRLSSRRRDVIRLQPRSPTADTSIEESTHEFRARRPTSHIDESRRSCRHAARTVTAPPASRRSAISSPNSCSRQRSSRETDSQLRAAAPAPDLWQRRCATKAMPSQRASPAPSRDATTSRSSISRRSG